MSRVNSNRDRGGDGRDRGSNNRRGIEDDGDRDGSAVTAVDDALKTRNLFRDYLIIIILCYFILELYFKSRYICFN